MAKRSKGFDTIIGIAVLAGISVMAIPSPNDESADELSSPSLIPGPVFPELEQVDDADAIAINDVERVQNVQAQRIADLPWGRNPFLGPTPDRELEPVLEIVEPEPDSVEVEVALPYDLPHLTGVSQVGDRKLAILDRQIVEEGELIASGFKLLSIDRNSVVVQRDGRVFTLSLDKNYE